MAYRVVLSDDSVFVVEAADAESAVALAQREWLYLGSHCEMTAEAIDKALERDAAMSLHSVQRTDDAAQALFAPERVLFYDRTGSLVRK